MRVCVCAHARACVSVCGRHVARYGSRAGSWVGSGLPWHPLAVRVLREPAARCSAPVPLPWLALAAPVGVGFQSCASACWSCSACRHACPACQYTGHLPCRSRPRPTLIGHLFLAEYFVRRSVFTLKKIKSV